MSANFQYIDLSYLDLMSDGDKEMKLTILEMLLEEIPLEMDKMTMLQQNNDWDNLREVSHKMKSTLSFIGNSPMTEANKRVEDIAKSKENLDDLPNFLAVLFDTYPQVLKELKMVATTI